MIREISPSRAFMRLSFLTFRAAVLIAFLSASSVPAGAQSFFQKLFGLGSDETTSAPTRNVSPSLREFGRVSPYGTTDPFDPLYPQSYSPNESGAYRTMCVRMCDGYYFPLSTGISRERFHRDAELCEQSCAGAARLFYLPSGSDDLASMTDLSGRVYGRLPTAFLYRKKLINGCACKPMPWSAQEQARHRHYELVEMLAHQQQENPVSTNDSGFSASGLMDDTADEVPGSMVETPSERSSSRKSVKLTSLNATVVPGSSSTATDVHGGAMHLMPSSVTVSLKVSQIATKSTRSAKARRTKGPADGGFFLFGPGGLFSSN